MILKIQELSGLDKVELVIMKFFLERILDLIKHRLDSTITKYSMDRAWSLMCQVQDNTQQRKDNKLLSHVNLKTSLLLKNKSDLEHSNNLEVKLWKQLRINLVLFLIVKIRDLDLKVFKPLTINMAPIKQLVLDLMSIWKTLWLKRALTWVWNIVISYEIISHFRIYK